MRVLCKVSYDGSSYFGYQKQDDRQTIQKSIEDVLSKINKKDIVIHASGRTDAHVHAYGQMFHFDTDLNLSEVSWIKAMNSLLPLDIRILNVYFVEDDFHARFNVVKKNYIYKINVGSYNLFEKDYVTQLNSNLDFDKLKEASKIFIGKHDFRNFCNNNEIDANYNREIYTLDITKDNNYIYFSFIGDGFKRYMIRMIVGTIVEYSKGRIDLNYISDRLDNSIFNTTHYNISPNGLYLNKVYYGRDEIDEN